MYLLDYIILSIVVAQYLLIHTKKKKEHHHTKPNSIDTQIHVSPEIKSSGWYPIETHW